VKGDVPAGGVLVPASLLLVGGLIMRSKLLTLFLTVAVVTALATEFSSVAFARQENANKPAAPAKKAMKKKRKPGGSARQMAGVPMGVENCLNHLAKMAAADPLIDYEGHPAEIVNNGLMWNDPKSKCAVSDPAQRKKIYDMAEAWHKKDAAKVRQILGELGANAEAAPPPPPRKPRPRPRKAPAKAAANSNKGL
jgi:hypothetical protein